MIMVDLAHPAPGLTPAWGPVGSTEPEAIDPHEERFAQLMHRWWQEDRPGWTELAWWEATLHDSVRALLWLEPGPALIAALAELGPMPACGVDHGDDRLLGAWPVPGSQPGWPCACQVIRAAAWEACASWTGIGAAIALVDAAGPQPVDHPIAGGRRVIRDPAREELAHALRTSLPAMANRIDSARAVAASETLVESIRSGTISSWAARLITQHVTDLPEGDAERIITEVSHRIRQRLASGRRPWHSAEINRLARAVRMRVCPETEREARVRAHATRRVCVQPGTDGMATLIADLDATDAHRIHRRLSAIASGLESTAAQAGEPEDRTRDQLRADILVDILLGNPLDAGGRVVQQGTTAAHEPGKGLGVPEIQVIVTLASLLGQDDEPAQVPGIGPVPAEVARELAADGRWRAWIADAAGAITATGCATYTPSAAVARLVRAREPRCRFPGCHQPAARCDLDHAIPWPRGSTEPANLGPLCRRHHTMKTHGAWRLVPDVPVRPVGSDVPVPAVEPDAPGVGTEPGVSGALVGDRRAASPTTPDPSIRLVTSHGWTWRTPAGLTVTDGPQPALGAWLGTPPAAHPPAGRP